MKYAVFEKCPVFAREGQVGQPRRDQGDARRAQRVRRGRGNGAQRPPRWRGDHRRYLVARAEGAAGTRRHVGRRSDGGAGKRERRRARRRTRQGSTGPYAAEGRRRGRGPQGSRQGRDGVLLLSLHLACHPRAAELHRRGQGEHRRDLGPVAESAAGAAARRQDARHRGEGRHDPHDALRRRLRPTPQQRLHGRSGVDRATGRGAGQAPLVARRRHAPRLLSSCRVAQPHRWRRCRGKARRLEESLRVVWGRRALRLQRQHLAARVPGALHPELPARQLADPVGRSYRSAPRAGEQRDRLRLPLVHRRAGRGGGEGSGRVPPRAPR